MSVRDDLTAESISLSAYAAGNHKTLCPKCSHTRKHPTDPCLSVAIGPVYSRALKREIKEGEAFWKCHNCTWTGSNNQGKTDAERSRTGFSGNKKTRSRNAGKLWRREYQSGKW